MTLNYLINTINFFFRLISAFFCASIILMIGIVYIYNWVSFTITRIIDAPFDWDEVGTVIGYAIGQLLLLPPVLHCGVAFGRFFLRVTPPHLSGRVRFGALLLSLLPAVVFAFFSVRFLFNFFTSNELLQGDRSLLMSTAVAAVLLLMWCVAFAFPLLERHLKPLSFLDQPFVLFLRRFSNFSDRAVINLILRQTSPTKPVVFLVPPRSRAGDWNPLLVGFAGMKLHPFRSIPVIVKSQETEWKQAIQLLINRAQIVILDISEKSDAIETELEMINQAACWQKTIFLKNISAKTDYELEQNIRLRNSQIICYRKSWFRGIPRMILGLWAIALSQILTIWVIVIAQIDDSTVKILCLLIGFLFLGWLYFLLFVRPSIDRASKISLKKILWGDGKSNISQVSHITTD